MFFIYIMTNERHNVMYVGSTSDLVKRTYLHKNRLLRGFTSKYNLTKLVYFESYETEIEAFERENKLKKMLRNRKEGLIEKINPNWKDLYFEIKGRSEMICERS